MKKQLFCLLLTTLTAVSLFATADGLFINHITRQFCWFSDDSYVGIGWKSMGEPDRALEQKVPGYEKKGYRYTSFPYTLDLLAVTGPAVLILFLLFRIKKRKHNPAGKS